MFIVPKDTDASCICMGALRPCIGYAAYRGDAYLAAGCAPRILKCDSTGPNSRSYQTPIIVPFRFLLVAGLICKACTHESVEGLCAFAHAAIHLPPPIPRLEREARTPPLAEHLANAHPGALTVTMGETFWSRPE